MLESCSTADLSLSSRIVLWTLQTVLLPRLYGTEISLLELGSALGWGSSLQTLPMNNTPSSSCFLSLIPRDFAGDVSYSIDKAQNNTNNFSIFGHRFPRQLSVQLFTEHCVNVILPHMLDAKSGSCAKTYLHVLSPVYKIADPSVTVDTKRVLERSN